MFKFKDAKQKKMNIKQMKKYIFLAAAAISLTACNTEDIYTDEPVSVQVSATIGESVLSRASDVSWEANDNIGISMGDRYINLKYTTEKGDGTFDGTVMYFKNKQEQVTLTAYYPFTGDEGTAPGANGVIEVNTGAERQIPDEQSKFDFLYAVEENVTAIRPNVNLRFSHRMSKLTFVFKNGNDGTDVSKITSCEINGLVLDGTFNTATGECAAKADTPSAAVSLTFDVKNEEALPSLLFFPQTVDKVVMKITDSEAQEYSCELKFNDNRIESGNSYVYTITVKKTGLTVNPCEITEWTVIDKDPDNPDKPLNSEAVSD